MLKFDFFVYDEIDNRLQSATAVRPLDDSYLTVQQNEPKSTKFNINKPKQQSLQQSTNQKNNKEVKKVRICEAPN